MYIPPAFSLSQTAMCHALMRAHPFATLVSHDASGRPFASHLPLILDPQPSEFGTLYGHLARANPQARLLGKSTTGLVIFQGPHSYVSPRWYESRQDVPTWNYVVVHAYVRPKLLPTEQNRHVLEKLVQTFEGFEEGAWDLNELPRSTFETLSKHIVSFELKIDQLEGKAKLSQNRAPSDTAGVRKALEASEHETDWALARWMSRLNLGQSADLYLSGLVLHQGRIGAVFPW
jgi:transcriptional regulator